ncbi:MAG: hypothetical protein LR011_09905 [Verrucomicrobia bacterium]|nr:hypothetical protein [Verrucomicrobiota bacterium]
MDLFTTDNPTTVNSQMTLTRRKSCTDAVSIRGIARRRWHHLLVLILVAYPFRHAVNPDGIAYLQIARHFVNFDLDLAISGYWGPLLSGIFCPFLALDVPPLVTARIVMAISTLFFPGEFQGTGSGILASEKGWPVVGWGAFSHFAIVVG